MKFETPGLDCLPFSFALEKGGRSPLFPEWSVVCVACDCCFLRRVFK